MSALRFTLLGGLVLAASGCFIPQDTSVVPGDRACTRCHGDPSREGTVEQRAAPPFDRFGNTGTQFRGVGAHERHLLAGPTHAAIACTECHRIPTTAQDDGHNVGITAFEFGPLAKGDGGIVAAWDAKTLRCTNACHQGESTQWTAQHPQELTCGTCHTLPPKAPHPQAGNCAVCHADVVAADGGIIAPELHVNGSVQVSQVACNACHGTDDGGAPPRAVDGSTERTAVGVGAHALHLAGGSKTKPVACATCHLVPASIRDPKHANGGRAEVSRAVGWNTATVSCTNGCHGSVTPDGGLTALVSPEWTTLDAGLGCSSCHGAPPALPHPQVTNCALCHPNATGPLGRDVVNRELHVNGTVEQGMPTTCDGCHGMNGNFAPPRDTLGNTATTFPGVGAHQAHVVGRGMARVVQCNECHVVPAQILATNHPNGTNEVRFTGMATINNVPSYQNGTCSVGCHNVANITEAPGGGTATSPQWTLVDGSQATCTSCHGLPPPLPHPQQQDCASCHLNITAARTFIQPEKHVNGTVEFIFRP